MPPQLTLTLVVGVPHCDPDICVVYTNILHWVEHTLILGLKSPQTRCYGLEGTGQAKINGYHMLPNEGTEQGTLPWCLGGRPRSAVIYWEQIPA